MSLFENEKKTALSIIEEGKPIISKTGSGMDIKVLDNAKESLSKSSTYLVVCGECSVGKSSFLTEYIREEGFFPVDADVATNCITIMSYAQKEKITVVMKSDNDKKFKEIEIQRKDIRDYVTEQGNKGNLKDVSTIRIETPNEALKNGLVLVDTPGVGGLDKDHSEVTAAFIPSADAVIYASAVTKPLDTYELEFIRDKIAHYCDNVVFALTKADKASMDDKNEILKSNREKIAQYTGWAYDDIRIVPISSLAMQSYRKRGKKEHYINSNFEELENQIVQSYTNRKITKTILPNIQRVKGVLAENYTVQAEKYNTLLNDDDEIQELKKLQAEGNAKRKDLLKQNQAWRSILARSTRNMLMDLTKQSRMYVDRIADQVDDDTTVKMIIENETQAKAYIKNVQKQLGDAGAKLQQSCDLYMHEIIGEIETELSQSLTLIESKGAIILSEKSFNNKIMINDKEKMINIIRAGSMGAAAGTFAGTAVGWIFGTAVAWPIGLAAIVVGGLSIIFGGKRQVMEAKQKNNNLVWSTANKGIAEARKVFSEYISEVRNDIEEYCTVEVENSIKSQIEKYDKMLDEIPEKITMNQEKKKTLLAEAKVNADALRALIIRSNNIIDTYQNLSKKFEEKNKQRLDAYRKEIEAFDKEEKGERSTAAAGETKEERTEIKAEKESVKIDNAEKEPVETAKAEQFSSEDSGEFNVDDLF